MPNRLLPLLLAAALGAGCAGSAPVRYYLIDAEPGPVLRREDPLALAIVDLEVPRYLERFQLATRSTDNELAYAADHQWGEPLRKMLLRVLAEHLAVVLSTPDVATPEARLASRPDLRLQVHLERFERGADGFVELRGRWQLTDADDGRVLLTEAARLGGGPRIADGDHRGLVAAMQARFAEFAQRIARSVAARAGDGEAAPGDEA